MDFGFFLLKVNIEVATDPFFQKNQSEAVYQGEKKNVGQGFGSIHHLLTGWQQIRMQACSQLYKRDGVYVNQTIDLSQGSAIFHF